MLLACVGLLLLIGCAMPEQNYGMGHEFGFFAPSFGGDDKTVDVDSRVSSPPSIPDSSKAKNILYVAQLEHFTVIPELSESNSALEARILGISLVGELQTDYPEAGQYTVTYTFPEDEYRIPESQPIKDGRITVTIRNNGTFSYSQHLIVDLGNDSGTGEPYGIWYLLYEIENGFIQTDEDTRGSYYADGVHYFGQLTDNSSDYAQITNNDYAVGKATSFIRGEEDDVQAYVSIERIGDESTEVPLPIAEKSVNELTIDDILDDLETIKEFEYNTHLWEEHFLFPILEYK